MIAASLPSGCARIAASTPVGVLRRHHGDQLPLVGDVERVEPQHLAGAADLGPQRDRRLVQYARPPAEAAASSLRALDSPPRVGSRMQRMSGHASSIASVRSVQRRRVAFQHGLELQPLAHRHDGDAVVAEGARDEDAVAGPGVADRQSDGPRAPGRCRRW